MKAAIDRRKGTNAINPQLAAKVALYGAADAWAVSLIPFSEFGTKDAQVTGPLDGVLQGDLLKKVTESSGSVTFDSPVRVTGEFLADTSQNANSLADVVKFLAAMIQTSGGEAGAKAATLIQGLNVSTEGRILKLALAIPEDQLESLIESAGKPGQRHGKIPEKI